MHWFLQDPALFDQYEVSSNPSWRSRCCLSSKSCSILNRKAQQFCSARLVYEFTILEVWLPLKYVTGTHVLHWLLCALQLTDKSDVYSYGVLLLVILTGQRPVDLKRQPRDQNLVNRCNRLMTQVCRFLIPTIPRQGLTAGSSKCPIAFLFGSRFRR